MVLAFIAGAVTFTFVGDNSSAISIDGAKVKIIAESSRKTVPLLNAASYSDEPIKFEENKIVVLNFWASWCGPCQQETPLLVNLAKEFPQVQFIGLTSDDTADDALSFADQYEIEYQIGNGDEYLAELTPIQPIAGLPTTFILDTEHRIAAKVIGAISEKEFRKALQTILKN
ncbi:MAG: hypothetical protein RLZZ330_1038 [Actinomycetota bacterium]